MAQAPGKITKNMRDSHGRCSARSNAKRYANKLRRRLEKRLIDDAPKVVTKGWAD